VQLAQFDEPGSASSGNSEPQTTLRSIVVDRNSANDSVRSAQIPSEPDSADPTARADNGALQFEAQPRNPFGDLPEQTLPPLESPADEFQPALPLTPTEPGLSQPADIPAASDDVIEQERQKSAAACSESLENLRSRTIDTVNLSIAVSGDEGEDFPHECSIDQGGWHAGRAWSETTYLWKASALCHKPLYFEDEQLERYGHSWPPCCQPLVSGAHFFTRLPVLPYCMGVEPPTECIYALGHYRPGSCAPYMIEPIPISCRGALFQAGAVAGTAAVLP